VSLDDHDIERIATRTAQLLTDQLRQSRASRRLVDAAELAATLGVERDWVYAHARQLGAVRLGGPRGRLRFDVDAVTRLLAQPSHSRPLSPTAKGPWQTAGHHIDSPPTHQTAGRRANAPGPTAGGLGPDAPQP
jgi:hypothetical protein